MGERGEALVVPVDIKSNTEISGINYDLSFDPERVGVEGVDLVSEGMTLAWSQPSSGILRVIIFSLSGINLSDGTTTNITFRILRDAPLGTFPLILTNTAMTDPEGSGVSHDVKDGSFTVEADN